MPNDLDETTPLAVGMWILTSTPAQSPVPKPFITKNCATFFSSDEKLKLAQWIPGMSKHGIYKLGGCESLYDVLTRLKAGGCTHIEVDPQPIVRLKVKIDHAISFVKRVLDGEFDIRIA